VLNLIELQDLYYHAKVIEQIKDPNIPILTDEKENKNATPSSPLKQMKQSVKAKPSPGKLPRSLS